MKSSIQNILCLAILTSMLPPVLSAKDGGKSIYGEDSRGEFYSVSAEIQRLSDSVVSLWEEKDVVFNPAFQTYSLFTEKLGNKYNLCPGEKFREQPAGAFCSGSLVGEDLIMTTGHCVPNDMKCGSTKFVFGYSVSQPRMQAAEKVDPRDIYSCKEVVARSNGLDQNAFFLAELGPEYALIRLDRKVEGRKPLAINRANPVSKGSPVFAIGHPLGLPLKIISGATVRTADPSSYFVVDLDTFRGNSGSPVFNSKTKLIEGILVRGDGDFVQTPAGCNTMAVYSQNGGRGEDVTKIGTVEKFIPMLPAEKEAEAMIKANDIKAVNIGNITALRGLAAEHMDLQ